MTFLFRVFVFLIMFSPLSAKAADLFTITLTQGVNTATKGFTSVLDVFDKYRKGKLDTILANYNKNDPAQGTLDFRGIRMTLDYSGTGNNATLTFSVPVLGINKVFGAAAGQNGLTQEQAFEAFKDYLKKNKDDLLTKILKESVSHTPYDAVAGNPSSLMSQMADSAFSNPTLEATDHANMSRQGMRNDGFVLLSPSGGRHSVKASDGTIRKAATLRLPLGYTFKFRNDWALGIDLPLSYTDLEGSKTYAAQIGASLQIPFIKDKWLMTFSGRVGATASKDTLSGGLLYMGAVTSRFTQKFGEGTALTMINMFGHIQDYSLNVDKYDIEYGLKNNVFKNGLEIRQKLGEKTALTVFGYDTRFKGSDLYIDSYREAGAKYTLYFSKDSFFTGIDVFGCYIFGKNYKAYNAGVSLLF